MGETRWAHTFVTAVRLCQGWEQVGQPSLNLLIYAVIFLITKSNLITSAFEDIVPRLDW